MKRKNKFIENSKIKNDESQYSREKEENNYSFQENKKENLINDLKLKGFNEIQIDDILETLIRNSISDRKNLIEAKNSLNIQEAHTIDTEMPLNKKIGVDKGIKRKNKNIEYINYNSKYKNSFIIKTESTETKQNAKNKEKYNCAKIYINASSEKDRNIEVDLKDNINDNKNNGKIVNFKKYSNFPPRIPTHNNSKKINNKYGNYLSKYSSQYGNNINKLEENTKEILKKNEYEINNNYYKYQRNSLYNNYNFKMIFDSKKYRDNMENIGYSEINNNSNRETNPPQIKSRNINNEENKNNNSNSFSIKQKLFSSINQESFDLNEIKEEKENNENNKDNNAKDFKNKENGIKKINEIIKEEKHNKRKNKGKYNTMRKFNKDKKKLENFSNKFINTKKIFSNINNNKKEIPSFRHKKNNIFMIRKQNTEEEEKLAKKNIAIIEIKQNAQQSSKKYDINEKNNKSKSLSKINNIQNERNNKNWQINDNLKRSLSNYNHTFVNINLCKGKNCSTFYRNRGISNKENSFIKIKNNVNKEEKDNLKIISSYENLLLNENDNEKDLIYNKINKSLTIVNTENNDNLSHSNKLNHILVTSYNLKYKKNLNEEELQNLSNPNNKSNCNSSKDMDTTINYIKIKNEDNLNIYLKKIKKYENGIYEGIMLNDKREIKGIMTYSNGAKYDGQWRNDKKNGKGIFTSSHYYNCKNAVGMKYEGEFKDDKFDGFGVTNYTNGDKYEGEWKNNKQYGKGVVSYFDGSKYDGEWKDGKFDGIGTFYLKNGEKYEGRFKDNKYNGYGKYYYNNGNYLEGIFRNDHPKGNCILYKTDGSIVNVQH